jgi:hypothetical protein
MPRRSHLPPLRRKTPLSDWWVVRFASTRIADVFTYRTISSRDTPDLEIDIEMQAFHLDLTDHDDDHNTSRPERDLEKDDMRMRLRTVSRATSYSKKVN